MRPAAPLPALITAGGRLSPDVAAASGATVKALANLDGESFLARVLAALRSSEGVSAIAVAGPVETLQKAGIEADVWAAEGATGPENIRRGIEALRASGTLRGEERLLLCATDAVFLHPDTVQELMRVAAAEPDADIVFPIVHSHHYEQQFPGSPNTYARLADGAFTGSSVQIVRPSAIERSLPLIERAFAARKSQWEMARLLDPAFVWRFVTRTLTSADAVAKVSAITGLRCVAPVFSDARIAADVDTLADYQYACRVAAEKVPALAP